MIETKDPSASWWIPPCRRKRSRIRPTPGSPPRSRGCSVCQREGVGLHQNYRRVAKRAAIMDWRYTRALQSSGQAATEFLHKRLGRVVRDLRRKIEGSQRRRRLGRYSISRGVCASRAVSARAEDLFVARPQVHRPRQRLGLPSLAATPVTAPKGGSSGCMPRHWTNKSLRRLCNRSRHRQPRKLPGYRPRITATRLRGHNCPTGSRSLSRLAMTRPIA